MRTAEPILITFLLGRFIKTVESLKFVNLTIITSTLDEDLHTTLQAGVTGWGIPIREIPCGESHFGGYRSFTMALGKTLANSPELLGNACSS